MSDIISELSAPSEGMVEAFRNAQPVSSLPVPEPQPAPTPAPEVSAPAPVEAAAVEPGTVAPPAETAPVAAPAFDPNAWLQEQYKASPDEVKAALESRTKLTELEAEVQRATHLREIFADSAKLREFTDLTTQDFGALKVNDPKALLFAQFKAQNAALPADVAKDEFEIEYNAKFPGLNYEDEDSELHQRDVRRQAYAVDIAAQFMQGKQEEARKVLDAPQATAAPEGPTAEEVEAQAQQAVQEVDAYFTGLEGFDFDVDGQKVAMPISNLEAVKAATLDLGGFITNLVMTDGKVDVDKVARVAYKLTEDIAGHAAKAAKGSAGPVVPMGTLVNNPTAAPAAHPGDRAGLIAAIGQAARPSQDDNY